MKAKIRKKLVAYVKIKSDSHILQFDLRVCCSTKYADSFCGGLKQVVLRDFLRANFLSDAFDYVDCEIPDRKN